MNLSGIKALLLAGLLLGIHSTAIGLEIKNRARVTTQFSALDTYEDGFAWDTMRSPSGAGIILNDMVLLENDGPGAGFSERGLFREYIHYGTQAKKTFYLEQVPTKTAHVVILMKPLNRKRSKQAPYYIVVNGHRIEGQPIAAHEGTWHWVPVSTAFLKPGENVVIVASDAPKDQGYALYLAREDEYEKGGGFYTYQGNTAMVSAGQVMQPVEAGAPGFKKIVVGQTSAKSSDGGESWSQGRLGPEDDVVGEYTIRLSMQQYKSSGYLRSPPVDLWDGIDGFDVIKPQISVNKLRLVGAGEMPEGTQIAWSVRFADTADMMSKQWGSFRRLGTAADAVYDIGHASGRYLQWQAELVSSDSRQTPVVKSVTIEREMAYWPLRERAFFVREYENVNHRYRSFDFRYERHDHPLLKQLHDRLALDQTIQGAVGDFEKINRVRHHVATQWPHEEPRESYPEWNAHEILDRKQQLGSGGMCIQFAVVFMQAVQALGYQAQFYNLDGHESTEVWVDEFNKWIHVDAWGPSDSYEYNTRTGEPLNILEQHEYFLNRYGFSSQQSIDWMKSKRFLSTGQNAAQPLYSSTFSSSNNNPKQKLPQHRLVTFARILTRNDFFSRPYPRPLNQGLVIHWPWNGYLNWYDDATPRKLQYALHSDREADFHPTLNRVEFSAVHAEKEGDLEISMITVTPNFAMFEINIDGLGWQTSPTQFTWTLRPSALNKLEMRVKNQNGVTGKPSHIQILWNYAEPFGLSSG